MSELESAESFDDGVDEVVENEAPTEEVETESAPVGESEQEAEKVESEEEPDRYAKRINKKHREMMEAKEEAEALRKELEALKSKSEVDIPDVPEVNPYADDYEEQLKARDAAIAARIKHQAKQELIQEQERQKQEAAAKAELEKFNKSANDFFERGKKLGLTEEGLSESAGALSALGFPHEVARDLIDDEDGAAIITHLANNPDIAEELAVASPLKAARMIETVIRPNALKPFKVKQKTSNAPLPDEPISRTAPVADSPLLKGARFE